MSNPGIKCPGYSFSRISVGCVPCAFLSFSELIIYINSYELLRPSDSYKLQDRSLVYWDLMLEKEGEKCHFCYLLEVVGAKDVSSLQLAYQHIC